MNPSGRTRQVTSAALGCSLKVGVFDMGEASRGDQAVGKGGQCLEGAVAGVGLMVLPLREWAGAGGQNGAGCENM